MPPVRCPRYGRFARYDACSARATARLAAVHVDDARWWCAHCDREVPPPPPTISRTRSYPEGRASREARRKRCGEPDELERIYGGPYRRTRPRDREKRELLKAVGTPEHLLGPPAGLPEGPAIAVVADIHGESAALAAVVEEARAEGIERWWCLGDTVEWLLPRDPHRRGDPEALRWLLDQAEIVLTGNHEAALLADPQGRERLAAEPDGQALLARLTNRPARETVELGGTSVELVHGSPTDPLWGMVEIEADAEEAFRRSRARIILCGHTHLPLLARWDSSGVRLEATVPEVVALDIADTRWLMNPGSVGRAPSRFAHWGTLRLDADGEPALFTWQWTHWAGSQRIFR